MQPPNSIGGKSIFMRFSLKFFYEKEIEIIPLFPAVIEFIPVFAKSSRVP
jgi:hypothetical protein